MLLRQGSGSAFDGPAALYASGDLATDGKSRTSMSYSLSSNTPIACLSQQQHHLIPSMLLSRTLPGSAGALT
jgi:hypothetical protein